MLYSLALLQGSSRHFFGVNNNAPSPGIISQRAAHDNVGHVLPPDSSPNAAAGPAHTHPSVKQRIGIVGTPSNVGQVPDGVELAPGLLRGNGALAGSLRFIGFDVKEYGDVDVQPVENDTPWLDHTSHHMSLYGAPVLNARTAGLINCRTAQVVEEIVGSGRAVLHLGGDRATVVGSIVGHARAQQKRLERHPQFLTVRARELENNTGISDSSLAVLWVDAHADATTPITSDSGSVPSMPVGFLLKELAQYMPVGDVPGFEWLNTNSNAGGIAGPPLLAHNIAYIGLRRCSPAERLILEKFGIKHYGMKEIDRYGIQHCVDEALQHINPDGTLPLHCSFDIDSLDPYDAPSTGTPELGGLTLREALTLCEIVHESGTLAGFDMVEVNPRLGTAAEKEKTLDAAVQIIRTAFGYPRYCWYVEQLKTLDYIERGGDSFAMMAK